jgi:hypothetical protein
LENIYLRLNVNGRTKLGGDTTPLKGSWKLKSNMINWTENRNSKAAVVVVLVALAIATDLT